MNKSILITIVLVLVAAGAGFYGGMTYQKTKVMSVFGNRQFGQMGRNGNGSGNTTVGGVVRMGLRPVVGEVTSVDEKTITVKLEDGSSKIVVISDSTSINKTEKTSISELKAGTRISAFGQENSDGTVSAQNIQLNPEMRQLIQTP